MTSKTITQRSFDFWDATKWTPTMGPFQKGRARMIWRALYPVTLPFVTVGNITLFMLDLLFGPKGWPGDNRLNDPMWALPPSAYERAGYMPPAPGRHRGTDSDGSGAS